MKYKWTKNIGREDINHDILKTKTKGRGVTLNVKVGEKEQKQNKHIRSMNTRERLSGGVTIFH
jgi:hypothetical protein